VEHIVEIPLSTQGFNFLQFCICADDWLLRKKIGVAGIREFRELAEFEDSVPAGNA
jgi:hypothetical protein